MLQLVQNGIERSLGELECASAEVLQRLDQRIPVTRSGRQRREQEQFEMPANA
jgi:hypothetical protein